MQNIKEKIITTNDLLRNIPEHKKLLIALFYYKYLSDRLLFRASLLLEEPENNLQQSQAIYAEAWADDARSDLINDIKNECGYLINPTYTINGLKDKINNHNFQTNDIKMAFNQLNKITNTTFQKVFTKINVDDISNNVMSQVINNIATFQVIKPDNNTKSNILESAQVFLSKITTIINEL